MSNDSKYVRLYPERALAPLRDLCQRIMHEISSVSYRRELSDAICQLDLLGFPENEPLFLLRGKDTLASAAVRFYSHSVGLSPGAFGGVEGKERAAAHILEHADRMERWQPRKLPD